MRSINGNKYLIWSILGMLGITIPIYIFLLKLFQKSFIIPDKDSILLTETNNALDKWETNATIRIIVWNVYKAKKKGIIDDLASFIKESDILLLQEHFHDSKLISRISKDSTHEITTAISFYTKAQIPTGVCTVSKVKHSSVLFLKSEGKEPLSHTSKMSLITSYNIKKTNKRLCVINVHGINFVRKTKFNDQMKKIEIELSNHKGSVIMGGDFNTWNKGRRTILRQLANKYNLDEVRFDNDKRRMKLDFIFIRAGKIQTARIMKEISSSDHLPLYLEFKLQV